MNLLDKFEKGFPPVLNKKDFVRRYEVGEFGNRSPTWNSIEHMEEDEDNSFPLMNDEKQLWHIRNRIAGGETWYNVGGLDLPDKWAEACKKIGASNLYISAMAPTEKTLVQGELQQTPEGLYLFASYLKKPMREALKEKAFQYKTINARTVLDMFLCPNSREWIEVLLDRYPDHVIEFSAYDCYWGTLPRYNTVTWEVRQY